MERKQTDMHNTCSFAKVFVNAMPLGLAFWEARGGGWLSGQLVSFSGSDSPCPTIGHQLISCPIPVCCFFLAGFVGGFLKTTRRSMGSNSSTQSILHDSLGLTRESIAIINYHHQPSLMMDAA